MDTLISFVLTTISSVAFSTGLLIWLSWLLRNWICERLRAGIRHEYDDRLEKLKAELKSQGDAQLASMKSEVDRQAEKLRIASSSFSEVQKATISKRIEAVDALWDGCLGARVMLPSSFQLTDMFTDEEVIAFFKSPAHEKLFAAFRESDPNEFMNTWSYRVEKHRPHLGEYIWALHSAYHEILMRAAIIMRTAHIEASMTPWGGDETIRRMVGAAFGQTGRATFEQLPYGRFRWLSSQFEHRLFVAIDELLTGKAFSLAALEQAQSIDAVLRANQVDQSRSSGQSIPDA